MTARRPDARPMFPADAVVRRVDGERVLLVGAGRALLMQLAHPLVAKGIAEHSDFHADPYGRLRRTLAASYTMTFGTVAEAERTAEVVRSVHERVRGEGYDANDPELVMWVHATLIDTALRVHGRFFGGLSAAEAEEYYRQSKRKAVLFGTPEADQPRDLAEFRDYMSWMVATLRVSDDARRLAHDIVYPDLPLPLAPLVRLGREVTAGLLPPSFRRQFGLYWDPLRGVALEAAALASRLALPTLPPVIRRVA
ncbi:MAG TPA: oxygenase MpaB family protein [Acidimicrobiales bacterium]